MVRESRKYGQLLPIPILLPKKRKDSSAVAQDSIFHEYWFVDVETLWFSTSREENLPQVSFPLFNLAPFMLSFALNAFICGLF